MVFSSAARRIVSTMASKQTALIGAAALGIAGVAAGFGLYNGPAYNKCTASVKNAYRQFMPMNDFPDLSKHNNCMASVLTPQLYAKLRDLVSNSTII